MRDVDLENDVHLFERKAIAWLLGVLSLCFTAWAGVVWSSGQDVVKEMRSARMEDAQYRLVMERRLTILEQQQQTFNQRQLWVIATLGDLMKRPVPQ
jgi:hypothetical protein